MERDARNRVSAWRRAGAFAIAAVVLCVAGGAAGCLNRPIDTLSPNTTSVDVEPVHEQGIDKIDLLLAIDNSSSMADKQALLALAIPDLVTGLLNPRCCVDSDCSKAANLQPAPTGSGLQPGQTLTSTEDCQDGFKREFTAVLDVHIGIVSSSIGGHGSKNCDPNATNPPDPAQNDAGHLITRSSAGSGQNTGFEGEGFLQWDPAMPPKYTCPAGVACGITQFGAGNGDGQLTDQLTDLVLGTGQNGCGFESQLESWYRFLVDPAPYATMTSDPDPNVTNYTQSGLDQKVLDERADFLRSDSLVAVIMLTDENDCSVREYGPYPRIADNRGIWLPRMECATNPNDACCDSCAAVRTDCPDESSYCLDSSGNVKLLAPTSDVPDLRCWNNKQRFGVDFLYPIERYQIALSQQRIPDPHNSIGKPGQPNDADNTDGRYPMVDNPLYMDLQKDATKYPLATHTVRTDNSRVFLAGIVGVPWQDIAVDPTDLTQGFKSAAQLGLPVAGLNSTWDAIIGDPATFKPPADPHMIESNVPRTGTDPLLPSATLAPPTAALGADIINGHERDTLNADLEYACIFTLTNPKSCAGSANCDCPGDSDTNPLCDPPVMPPVQARAKGYPGIRELSVLKGLGNQGIVGSICPAKTASMDQDRPDFGYRPAIVGIINQLKNAIQDKCLALQLNPSQKTGQVDCLLVEARNVNGGACDCSTAGREDVPEKNHGDVLAIEANPLEATSKWDCFCELHQLDDVEGSGHQLTDCLTLENDDAISSNGDGWCYVDPATEPSANPAIVDKCPDTEKRKIRFIGKGKPLDNSTLFITCSAD